MPKTESSRREIINRGTVAALLLLGFGVAVWIWQARATGLEQVLQLTQERQSVAEGSLRLSNGQIIWAGEPTQELLLQLKSSLRSASPGLLQYPGDLTTPVEVSIYTEDNKVSGLFVTKNGLNQVMLARAGIGASSAELKARLLPLGLTQIDTQTDKVKQPGYKLVRGNVSTYFLLPACGGDKVVSIVMALNGYDSVLMPFATLHDCTGQQSGVQQQ